MMAVVIPVVFPDIQAVLVHQDLMANQGRQGRLEDLELLEGHQSFVKKLKFHHAIHARLVPLDLLDLLVNPDFPAEMDHQADLEILDNPDRLAQLVLQVKLDYQEKMEKEVNPAGLQSPLQRFLENLENQVNLDLLDYPVIMGLQVEMVKQDYRDLSVLLDLLEVKDQQAKLDNQELLEIQDHKVKEEFVPNIAHWMAECFLRMELVEDDHSTIVIISVAQLCVYYYSVAVGCFKVKCKIILLCYFSITSGQ